MNTSNTFHSVAFDAAFAPCLARKSVPVMYVVPEAEDTDYGVDPEFDTVGETDLEILQAIVDAAS